MHISLFLKHKSTFKVILEKKNAPRNWKRSKYRIIAKENLTARSINSLIVKRVMKVN